MKLGYLKLLGKTVNEIVMEDAPRSMEDMKIDDDPRTKTANSYCKIQ